MSNQQPLDTERLRWALEESDIPVLLMMLVHLTGDRSWIDDPYRPKRDVRLFPDESGGLSDELQQHVRDSALRVLGAPPAHAPGLDLPTELYAAMMSTCVGEPVTEEYVALFLEEMGIRSSSPAPVSELAGDAAVRSVLIIGAGFSGLAAGVRLRELGFDITIVDRHPVPGGVWYENTYPDSGVDTPNHFYSYSFRPNLGWTSYFSKQPEVMAYIDDCVEHYGLRDHIQFETEVVETRWNESTQCWDTTVRRADDRVEILHSDVVISAVGHLNQPTIPDFPGLDSFQGEVFHTARWRHDIDLTGKRVAMIGVGASAIQAARNVAGVAGHFTIFQRSPQWVAPNPDYHRTVSDRKLWLLANVPYYAMWYRFVRFWRYGDGLLKALFKDPEWEHPERAVSPDNDRHRQYYTRYLLAELEGRPDLIDKTLPTYPPFGKRMLVDNEWFATLRRDNVELVCDDVAGFAPGGVVTASGTVYEVDVVIMATGFHARRYIWPMQAIGRRDLVEIWGEDDARAYLGITVPDMPNFFIMGGPNTSLAHGGSAIFQSECQVRYIASLLGAMVKGGYRVADLEPHRLEQYVAQVDELHDRLIWTHPGMSNWYRNSAGRVVTTTPWRMVDYWSLTKEADLGDYRLDPPRADNAEVASTR